MVNWTETIESLTGLSKFDLSEMIKQAEYKDACSIEIQVLSQHKTIEEALEHYRAPYWCLWYARNVLEERWKEVEPIILKSRRWSYIYAADIIVERWPEAEPFIAKDFYWKREYEDYFNCKIGEES